MPRTKQQYQEMKEERKESIVNTALFLFATHGYDSIKIDSITKASGCSHGLIYHYFPKKEDVFHAVMEKAIDVCYELYGEIDYTLTAKEALLQICKNINEALSSKDSNKACVLCLVLNLHLQKENIPKPPKEKPKKSLPKKLFQQIYELVCLGQKENDFIECDPYVMTISFLSLIKGLSYNRLNIGYKKFVCPEPQLLINMLLKK